MNPVSASSKFEIQIEGETITFWLRVQPRSSKEELRLDAQGQLRLRVTAPPVAGEANEAVVRFFARQLRIPTNSIEIVTGRRSTRKLIRIAGHPASQTAARLEAHISKPK